MRLIAWPEVREALRRAWDAVTVDAPAQGCRCLTRVEDWPRRSGGVCVQLEPRLYAVKHEHAREQGVCYCGNHVYR